MHQFQVPKSAEDTFERYTAIKDKYGEEKDEFENKKQKTLRVNLDEKVPIYSNDY